MATLSSSPQKWNLAYAPNIYTLSNLGLADRFVLKVYKDNIATGELLATLKQPTNPAGVAHFDISKILQSQLYPSYVENTTQLTKTDGASLTYQVYYGSETNGIFTPDGADTIKYSLNGYTNWRIKDWDYVDYIPNPNAVACLCEIECTLPTNAQYTRTYDWLTTWPTTNASGISKYKVRSNEYKTLSFFNRIYNWDDGTIWGPNEAPFFVKNTFYNAAGSVLAIDIKTISASTGLDIRTDCQDLSVTYPSDSELIGTIGVGPQNIKDGIFSWYDCAYYTVEIYSINSCYINDNGPISDCEDLATLDEYIGDLIYTAEFHVDDYCQKFEPITISFMNSFGVKDYFDFNKRNTYTTNITRNNYKQQLGSWSDSTWNIGETDRGRRTFSTMATTQMTLTTDWMTDAESTWLEELFVSPSANIYINGTWEPVVIISTDYQQMTSARNGMFQHEITVQFANDKNIQRG